MPIIPGTIYVQMRLDYNTVISSCNIHSYQKTPIDAKVVSLVWMELIGYLYKLSHSTCMYHKNLIFNVIIIIMTETIILLLISCNLIDQQEVNK